MWSVYEAYLLPVTGKEEGQEGGVMSDTPKKTEGFEDRLPLKAVRIAPGEYRIESCDGVRLWYMEGAALAEWVVESINGYAALREAADALEGKK